MRDYFEFSEALKAAVRTNCHHIVTVETLAAFSRLALLDLPSKTDVLDDMPHTLAM